MHKSIRYTLCFSGRLLGKCFTRKFQLDKEDPKILIIHIGKIGDFLRIFPLIHLLRNRWPSGHLFILSEYPHEFFSLLGEPPPILEELIIDTTKGIVEKSITSSSLCQRIKLIIDTVKSIIKKLQIIKKLRSKRFDLTICASRGGSMLADTCLSYLTNTPFRIGFDKDGAGFLNTTKVIFRYDTPIVIQNLALLDAIGIDTHDTYFTLHIPDTEMAFCERFFKEHNIHQDDLKVVIHPCVSWHGKYRCWPLDRFIKVSIKLTHQYGAKVIFVGSHEELKMIGSITDELMQKNFINAMGQTTILQLAALIKSATLFIGNDSGPLHIALGVKTPTISIFGPTNPEQVIVATDQNIPLYKKLPCSPCYYHQPLFEKFDCVHLNCLKSITVDEVMDKVAGMISSLRIVR